MGDSSKTEGARTMQVAEEHVKSIPNGKKTRGNLPGGGTVSRHLKTQTNCATVQKMVGEGRRKKQKERHKSPGAV